MPPFGERLSGGAVCPLRRGVASSEAEMSCSLEDRFAILERDGNAGRSRGSRWEPSSEAEIAPRIRGGMRMGRMLGFFESFPFFQIGRRPRAFEDPVALTCVCVF